MNSVLYNLIQWVNEHRRVDEICRAEAIVKDFRDLNRTKRAIGINFV